MRDTSLVFIAESYKDNKQAYLTPYGMLLNIKGTNHGLLQVWADVGRQHTFKKLKMGENPFAMADSDKSCLNCKTFLSLQAVEDYYNKYNCWNLYYDGEDYTFSFPNAIHFVKDDGSRNVPPLLSSAFWRGIKDLKEKYSCVSDVVELIDSPHYIDVYCKLKEAYTQESISLLQNEQHIDDQFFEELIENYDFILDYYDVFGTRKFRYNGFKYIYKHDSDFGNKNGEYGRSIRCIDTNCTEPLFEEGEFSVNVDNMLHYDYNYEVLGRFAKENCFGMLDDIASPVAFVAEYNPSNQAYSDYFVFPNQEERYKVLAENNKLKVGESFSHGTTNYELVSENEDGTKTYKVTKKESAYSDSGKELIQTVKILSCYF
jgi:hypothetical protein